LRDEVSKIVGVELGEPCFEVGKDGNVMIMHSRPAIRAHCAHGRSPAREGAVKNRAESDGEAIDMSNLFSEDIDDTCGDTTGAFITDMSYFYSLISDGMGSGSEAAFTSNVCAMFIEKMLSAGNRADITLRMLNNVIRSENLGLGSECSATVDLFELDLMSGAASFIKSGAAPTYVARGGTVYKISSRTMPVGIIKDADARITRFDTQKGDLIVLMSDGCCPDSEDCAWLVEYLCAYAKKNVRAKAVRLGENKDELCESIRDEILSLAVKSFPADRPLDDISVSVVLID
jgi:stage II sporulation protein E